MAVDELIDLQRARKENRIKTGIIQGYFDTVEVRDLKINSITARKERIFIFVSL